MATGWSLSIGYNSGYSYNGDDQEAWDELVRVTKKLCEHPERIEAEAYAYGAPLADPNGETLFSYCERYREQQGGTITINQDQRVIHQIASGDRAMKEYVRRAFCRLILQDMHRLNIEVNLIVA